MSCDSLFEPSQLSFVDSCHDVCDIHANTSQVTQKKEQEDEERGGGKEGKQRGKEKKEKDCRFFFLRLRGGGKRSA
jgi:hypothetical protein